MNGSLEISGPPDGLVDDDLLLRVRGAGPEAVTWRARLLDDDGRVWRATADRAERLATRWVPAKEGTGAIAALRSLRPVAIDVRAEAADGRAAARTVTRRFAGDGVLTRRWRGELVATLHAPADAVACATVVVDAMAGETQAAVATLAAPLLASRGVLVLVVARPRGRGDSGDRLALARERLAALPAAGGELLVLAALDPFEAGVGGAAAGDGEPAGEGWTGDGTGTAPAAGEGVVLPPGIGARDPQSAAAARAVAWDALLARLNARPREHGPAR